MRLLVCDNSQFVEFARCLGRSGLFDQVGYFSAWQDDTPIMQESVIGSGFEEIKREYNLWDAIDRYDAFAFPALHWDGMQRFLRARNVPVWGCGESEHLERDRWGLLEAMEKTGMNVALSSLVTLAQAREIIKEGNAIKISTFRGDIETVVHKGDWGWWYELNYLWGPMRDFAEVVVQEPIKGDCEPGFDFLISKGRWLEPFSVGYEVKDGGYIEKNIPISLMPKPLQRVYAGVQKLLVGDKDYSNFMATEILNDHLLDITTRMPQPPGDLKLFNWKGFPEIVLNTLEGKPVDGTQPQKPWGVQLIAHNNNPKNYCRWGKIDESLLPHVFFNRAINLGGEIWTVPWKDRGVQDWVDAASVCASSDSPEKAIDEAQRVVDELKFPAGVLIDPSTKEHLMKALEDGYKAGIEL